MVRGAPYGCLESGREAPLLPYYCPVPAASSPRGFGGATALFALVLLQPACSVLLNWDGYTGGEPEGGGDDLGVDPGSDAADANVEVETGGGVTDVRMDLGEARPRDDGPVAVDAGKPPCASQCGGCCDPSGNCFGGRSTSTCGATGARCTDCSTMGQVCNGGLCGPAPPPQDSGMVTPTCTVSSCFAQRLCVTAAPPFYQNSCCKSDQTCGCQLAFPPGLPCN